MFRCRSRYNKANRNQRCYQVMSLYFIKLLKQKENGVLVMKSLIKNLAIASIILLATSISQYSYGASRLAILAAEEFPLISRKYSLVPTLSSRFLLENTRGVRRLYSFEYKGSEKFVSHSIFSKNILYSQGPFSLSRRLLSQKSGNSNSDNVFKEILTY